MAHWILLTGALFLMTATFVESDDHEITYVQPQRFIKCPSVDKVCEIKLLVSNMHTLTAYNLNSEGSRGDSGHQVTINENGGFDFVYPERVQQANVSQLFQPIVADGTTRRNLLVINDQLPGPTIIGYKNQRVRIKVTNNLTTEAITLHWHGQHVNSSSGSDSLNQFSDGVPFITQCPIQPGNSFLYDYELFPAGTYWYHSHQHDERSNGIYGALVVLDSDQSTADMSYEDIPEHHTIAFFEWFPINAASYNEPPFVLPDPVNKSKPYVKTLTNDGTLAGFPPFFAGFMNSGGWRYNPSASDCTRVANISLPYFNVSRESSYRFRLIGAQVNYAFRFSISGHRLRVVATDSIDATVPSSITDAVDFIIVHIGERYDFILDAQQPEDNYLMLIETLEVPSQLHERDYCIKAHRGYAVLHYNGVSDDLPSNFDDSYDPLKRCTSADSPCFALNCPFQNYPADLNITCISVAQLQLSSPEPVPDNDVSESVFLNFGFTRGPSINDREFRFPPSPPLSQLQDIPEDKFCQYSNLQTPITPTTAPPNSLDPPTSSPIQPQPPFACVHTYTVDTDTVEMVYVNVALNLRDRGTAHPIHLHGHHFFVMDIGYPTYKEDGTVDKPTNAINCSADGGICNVGIAWADGYPQRSACEMNDTCPLKDTVIMPIGGYVRIRFSRDNWGWWIMHCHIERHLLGGMAMVVNETSGPGYTQVPNGFPTCSNFDSQNTSTPTTPQAPSTGDTITLAEVNTFRNATIALAIILVLVLAMLVSVVIALILVCLKKEVPKPKAEIEMK